MPPSLDPETLNDMTPHKSASQSVSPILILSPSSLSRRPQILESLLSSLPSSRPHDLQMLDRIALNFANLPQNHYSEAILALPSTEEASGEIDADYNELKAVMNKILETMKPGGRIQIGQPSSDQITKEAILAGFLIENENQQVSS
jgi:Fe-S cluster assembly protein DRE2 N-terminus